MATSNRNVLLIANPAAQRGHGAEAARIAHDLLREWVGDEAVTLAMTDFAGHAVELAAEASSERYDTVIALGGDGHAESGRDRVGGVAAGKRVVLALLGRGEREQPVVLPVGIKTAAAAREYLVGIGLMAHIPYQTVVWSIEDIVESHSELHHSEARGKVTGIVRQTVYKVSSELVA